MPQWRGARCGATVRLPTDATAHGMTDRFPHFKSMLFCADRSGEAQGAMRKASIMARHLDAAMELFACDAEHAWAVANAPGDAAARAELAACLVAGRRYLGALRGSIAASDLRLTTRAVCAGDFIAAVAARVLSAGHDLVVKNFIDGADPPRATPSAADMALAQACRVPLLLTRPRPWRPAPCVWAALDLQRCDARTGRRVVGVARALARGCHGSFALVYSRRVADPGPPPRRSVERAAQLLGIDASSLHLLEGDPREALPPALRAGGVDVLVIAQPDARLGTPVGGSLAERLLGPGDSDVLIVPTVGEALGIASRVRADAPQRQR